jgi:hypothetical protein
VIGEIHVEGCRCDYCRLKRALAGAGARAPVQIGHQPGELRGAFRALADIGCSVQLGLLAVYATLELPGWDGPERAVLVNLRAVEDSLLVGLGGRP